MLFSNELQHFPFASSQRVQSSGSSSTTGGHLPRLQALADVTLALQDRSHRHEKLVGVAGLQNEAGRSGIQELLEHALISTRSNYQHSAVRHLAGNLTSRFQAVHLGHADVHEDHVRLMHRRQ